LNRVLFPYLSNILSALFTADANVPESLRKSVLENIRVNPDASELDDLRLELGKLYSDASTDWVGLLTDDYEIYPARDQDDAREYVTSYIWEVLFPDNPPPRPG
jgi:hypothetical protein